MDLSEKINNYCLGIVSLLLGLKAHGCICTGSFFFFFPANSIPLRACHLLITFMVSFVAQMMLWVRKLNVLNVNQKT